jgi:asparagine synthase (glutamine-hydrolysing)
MVDGMEHRGPDGEGLWIGADRRIVLGHRRLSIVDLTLAGAQPMTTADGRFSLTFNGEIYNYVELRGRLEKSGFRFRSRTDTEVLLDLFVDMGPELVDLLDGDYAFGVWDEREQSLLLARDRAGVKPLYYAETPEFLVFASEVRAILASGLVAPCLDHAALYHYLTFLAPPAPMSLVQGIRKLPAASMLVWDRQRQMIAPVRYWDPLDRPLIPPRVSQNALDEEFTELFRRSVSKRLMADVPTGALFSGGVDSALNTAMFSEAIQPDRVNTFTVAVRDDPRLDEGQRARRLARTLGAEHHEVVMAGNKVLDILERLIWAQDEPVSDPVAVAVHFVTALARSAGTIVLQAGEGADEVFYGYDSYLRQSRRHRMGWVPLQMVPPALASLVFAAAKGTFRSNRSAKVLDTLQRRARRQEFILSSAVGYYESEKELILAPGFRQQSGGLDSFEVVRPLYRQAHDHREQLTFLQMLTYLELNLRLPELLLMRVDKMAMANSVEVRVPFLDHALIEFALATPDAYKLHGGVGKLPVKRLAAQYLPATEIYRRKQGFGAPVQQWLNGPLKEVAIEALVRGSEDWNHVFQLDELMRRMISGHDEINAAFQSWLVVNLVLWWERILKEFGRPVLTDH